MKKKKKDWTEILFPEAPTFTGVKARRGALSPQTDFLTRLK